MRPASAMLLITVLATPLLAAQNPPPRNNNVYVIHDGGTTGRMESITIPPITGAPFSLTLITEWSRTAPILSPSAHSKDESCLGLSA